MRYLNSENTTNEVMADTAFVNDEEFLVITSFLKDPILLES